MFRVLSETTPRARKSYNCMACQVLISNDGVDDPYNEYTHAEKAVIQKAKNNKWMIVKGEVYTNQKIKDGGDIYTTKAITAIHEICMNHDMYES